MNADVDKPAQPCLVVADTLRYPPQLQWRLTRIGEAEEFRTGEIAFRRCRCSTTIR